MRREARLQRHAAALRLGRLLALVGALTWLGACGDPEPQPHVQRLIGDEPGRVLVLADHLEDLVVGASELDAQEMARWRTNDLEHVESDGSPIFEIAGADPGMLRYTRWPADEIAAVRFEISGLGDAPLSFLWTHAGEPFGRKRKLVSRGGGDRGAHRFDLAGKHSWSGEIRRLQLIPGAALGSRFELRRIEWIRPHVPLVTRQRLAGEAWRVDLEGDRRPARIAPPTGGLEWRVDLPEAAELRFAVASLAPPGFGVDRTFRVVAEEEGEPAETLFEAIVSGTEPSAWREAQVDLSAWAGRSLLLRFESEAANPARGEAGLGLWSNPEIGDRAPRTRPPNVILISLDTLRGDHLSLNGYERETTPHLSAWASSSAVNFSQAVAQAPWTLPSHLSMMTGVEAYRHGVNYNGVAPANRTLLAERLRESGYSTWAVTGGAFLRPEHGFDRGFDLFRYWKKRHSLHELETHLEWAVDRLEAGVRWPFFLFFHTYEIHAPYQARQPWFSRFSGMPESPGAQPEDGSSGTATAELPGAPPEVPFGVLDETGGGPGARTLQKHSHFVWRPTVEDSHQPLPAGVEDWIPDYYDSGIAYTDEAMGELLSTLDRLGLAEETIVVITSDHGESLGEHDRAGHGYLFDHNLLVPLIVAYPARLAGGSTIDRQVRSIDIVPTILELAGIDPIEGVDGGSLVPLMEGASETGPDDLAVSYAPKSNYGLSIRRRGEAKYIFNNSTAPALRGDEEYYDLTSDPTEANDLATVDGSQEPTDPPAVDLSGWRRQAVELLDQVPGMRIVLENTTDATWRGSLGGPAFNAKKVKHRHRETASMAGFSDSPGVLVFAVPPGATLRLVAEAPPAGRIEIEVREGPPLDEGERLTGRLTVEPATSSIWSWPDHEAGTAPPAGSFTIRAHWTAGAGAEAEVVEDEALREQLTALGYIDVD